MKFPDRDRSRDEAGSWWPVGHIKEFVVKFLIELFVFGVLWVISFFLKKNYNVRDHKLREWLGKLHTFLNFIPRWDQGYADSISSGEQLYHFVKYEKDEDENQTYASWFEELETFIEESGGKFKLVKDSSVSNLFFPLLYDKVESQTIITINEEMSLKLMKFRNGMEMVIVVSSSGSTNVMMPSFGLEVNKDIKDIGIQLYEYYGDKLFVSTNNSGNIICNKIDEQNDPFFFPNDEICNQIVADITKCKQRGLQRSYVLYGEPGTGKTLSALHIMSKIAKRGIQFSSYLFNNLATNDIRVFLDSMEADMILVDDADRISISDMAGLLKSLERFKIIESKPTLIITVNSIETLSKAALRPGRFDRIFCFPLPNKKQRIEFFGKILKAKNIAATAKQIERLAEYTSGLSEAYLREYCLMFEIEENFDDVLVLIKQRKSLLGKDLDLEELAGQDELAIPEEPNRE